MRALSAILKTRSWSSRSADDSPSSALARPTRRATSRVISAASLSRCSAAFSKMGFSSSERARPSVRYWPLRPSTCFARARACAAAKRTISSSCCSVSPPEVEQPRDGIVHPHAHAPLEMVVQQRLPALVLQTQVAEHALLSVRQRPACPQHALFLLAQSEQRAQPLVRLRRVVLLQLALDGVVVERLRAGRQHLLHERRDATLRC